MGWGPPATVAHTGTEGSSRSPPAPWHGTHGLQAPLDGGGGAQLLPATAGNTWIGGVGPMSPAGAQLGGVSPPILGPSGLGGALLKAEETGGAVRCSHEHWRLVLVGDLDLQERGRGWGGQRGAPHTLGGPQGAWPGLGAAGSLGLGGVGIDIPCRAAASRAPHQSAWAGASVSCKKHPPGSIAATACPPPNPRPPQLTAG